MNHLYQRLNNELHAFKRVIIPTTLVLALLIPLIPTEAKAWTAATAPPQCAVPAALNGWNYKQKIRDVWPAWNPDTVQKALVVFEVWDGAAGETVTNMYFGDTINFKRLNNGEFGVTRTITSTSSPSWPYRDFTGTSNDSSYYMNLQFKSDPSAGAFYQNLGNFNGTPVSTQNDTQIITGTFSATPVNGALKCIASGVNVKYSADWESRRYDSLVPDNGLGATTDTCQGEWWKPWEKPACIANKAFQNFTGALTEAAKDVANGLATAFAFLFVPSDEFMNDYFTNETEYWQEKLGFLIFPLEAINETFGQFVQEDNYTGCSTSSCILNGGNFFGSNFSINFAAINNLSPALWTFIRILLQAGVILMLVFGLRHKFKDITEK